MMFGQNFDLNSRRSIFAIILINVIGPAAYIVQPALVQGFVEHLNFNEQQAGYVAAIEMWGVAITTVFFMFLTGLLNWRFAIACAALLMIVGNLLSLVFQDPFAFALTRGAVGIGEGVLISLGFTMLGLTRNPDRNFGLMVMWLLLFGAIVIVMLPKVYQLIGMDGLLIFFVFLSAIPLLILKRLPASTKERLQVAEGSINAPLIYQLLTVVSVTAFFIGIGAIWAYLFLIGVNAQGTEQSVANSLMTAQYVGAAGAFSAAILADRFGRIIPVTIALFGCLLAQLFFFDGLGFLAYFAGVCIFNFCYNLAHPYLYAVLSSIDRTGNIIRYAIAGQMIGIAIGPSIAASLVSPQSFSNVIFMSATFFLGALVLILPALLYHKGASTKPAFA